MPGGIGVRFDWSALMVMAIAISGCSRTYHSHQPCASDAECDDLVDCTNDACVSGYCAFTEVDAKCAAGLSCSAVETSYSALATERSCIGCCAPCLSQCELYLEDCEEQPIESFPGFDAARDQELGSPCASFGFQYVIAGRCEEGPLFIFGRNRELSRLQLYDAETRAFIGVRWRTDGSDPLCRGVSFWPSPLECGNATVTEELCGSFGGGPIGFPALP